MAAASNPYVRLQIRDADRNQQINKIAIVVHTEGRWESSSISNNHVTQYLSIPGGRSVQLNIRHIGEDDINGRFEMVSREYQPSESRSRIIDHEVPLNSQKPCTVNMVCNLVSDRNLNDFCFANGGMGCRYWHLTLIMLYQAYSWVQPTASSGVLHFLSFMHSRSSNPIPTTIKPGTFDADITQKLVKQLWTQKTTEAETRAHQLQRTQELLESILSNLTSNPAQAVQQVQQFAQAGGPQLSSREAVQAHLASIQQNHSFYTHQVLVMRSISREAQELTERRAQDDADGQE